MYISGTRLNKVSICHPSKAAYVKMITEVLFLHQYYPYTSYCLTYDGKNILSNDEFFADTVNTTENDVKQHRKQECLKGVIRKGKILSCKKQRAYEKVIKLAINLSIEHTLNRGSMN